MKLRIRISKYHSRYLCQISLQIMLLSIQILSEALHSPIFLEDRQDVQMSTCFNWRSSLLHMYREGGCRVFKRWCEELKMFLENFKSIIPGSQPLHKVLLWKDLRRRGSILSPPHCLGQVLRSALPRMASWCDGPHKDEPIKKLTDILELGHAFRWSGW